MQYHYPRQMEHLDKKIDNLLSKKISRRDFLKLIGKTIFFLALLGMLPLKWVKNKTGKIVIKTKYFKPEYIYCDNNLAG